MVKLIMRGFYGARGRGDTIDSERFGGGSGERAFTGWIREGIDETFDDFFLWVYEKNNRILGGLEVE